MSVDVIHQPPAQSERVALLFRTLIHCGFFGPSLPAIQELVLKTRMPRSLIEDALTLLQTQGEIEAHGGKYQRVYPAQKEVRPRVGVLMERSIFGHYFEVYQDYLVGLAQSFETAKLDLLFMHELTSTEGKKIAIEEMLHGGVQGFAVLGKMEPEVQAALSEKDLPVVICGNSTIEQRHFGCVCSDNIFGTKNLVRYLIAQGHKSIAYYATGKGSHDGYHHRFLGYRDAMLSANLEPSEAMLLENRHSASSANTAAEIFSGFSAKKRPTAIVCACDREAFELVSELQKSGISVPKDVSVAGFENSIFNAFSHIALTTVDIFAREMGAVAGNFLATSLKTPQLPLRIVLPSELIERDSVRRL